MARRGLGTDGIARLLGLSQGHAARVIAGGHVPRIEVLLRLWRLAGRAVPLTAWAEPYEGELPALPERRGRPLKSR